MKKVERSLDKLIFIKDYNNVISNDEELFEAISSSEPLQIELIFSSDQTIWEIRSIFKRLCLTLGYPQKTVDEAFPKHKKEDAAFDSLYSDISSMIRSSVVSNDIDPEWESKIEEMVSKIINNTTSEKEEPDVE